MTSELSLWLKSRFNKLNFPKPIHLFPEMPKSHVSTSRYTAINKNHYAQNQTLTTAYKHIYRSHLISLLWTTVLTGTP